MSGSPVFATSHSTTEVNKSVDEARADRPQSLDDLLRDYDAETIMTLTGDFAADPPTGKELI